jgi:DNA polymerase-3 subunit gamma/tau
MGYEVTATRKRPQIFDEMVGQDFVVATLKNSILQGRIAHAYLFSGPRGVGKTSAARILAKALNCEQGPTDTPCGQCTACREIAQGNSLDVIEIDGASNTSVNDVRQIKDEVLFAPNSSRYKIYIIDEVHMLSNSAFNALLKTIEEPPPYIVFIFATTEVHKVPATIRSRCQQFNFRLIGTDRIKQMLQSVADELGLPAEQTALSWMAKEATGSLRDAYTLLDQVVSFCRDGITMERIREKLGLAGIEQMNRLGSIISQRDKKEILEFSAEILDTGVSVEQLAVELTDYFRNLLFIKNGIRKDALLSFPVAEYSPEVYESFSSEQLERGIELLLELQRNLKFSLQQRFDLELALSQLASLQDLIQPAELLQTVQALRRMVTEGLPAGGEPGAPPSPTASRAPAAARPAKRGERSERSGPRPSAVPAAPMAAPGATEAPGQVEGHAGGPREAGTASGSLEDLVESVRKEKFALSTSLGKASSWELRGEELRLVFSDAFCAEQVLKEKDAVLRHAAAVFGRQPAPGGGKPLRLRVEVAGSDRAAGGPGNEQAEIVRKVFRGEYVKGE